MESLKKLQSNINEVMYFCEVTKKTQNETIEVLEILFDHYKSWQVDKFFDGDYYQRYIERLKEIRWWIDEDKCQREDDTLFI